MIHCNVGPNERGTDGDPRVAHKVEVSTNGAGWRTLYVVNPYAGETSTPRERAEALARTMGEAWTYAGISWRATSCGASLGRFA